MLVELYTLMEKYEVLLQMGGWVLKLVQYYYA